MTPCRIIPARAGNASSGTPRPRSIADHPRASGERRRRRLHLGDCLGSSPRERGTPHADLGRFRERRIIPARAGNASTRCRSRPARTDHPRASGERRKVRRTARTRTGSSPRERGTPGPNSTPAVPGRIIPARAGNANCRVRCAATTADHPRASGERVRNGTGFREADRSSPRERGTRARRLPGDRRRRISPARAGNAWRVGCDQERMSDHPRASGEPTRGDRPMATYIGSSPRERGTHHRGFLAVGVVRIIPARAGNAPPHFSLKWVSIGSSPRERGTLASIPN